MSDAAFHDAGMPAFRSLKDHTGSDNQRCSTTRSFSMAAYGKFLACLGLGAISAGATGQSLTGEIDGIVHDSTGSVIAGASVSIQSLDHQQVVRAITASGLGSFSATLLDTGRYAVKVSAPGFGTETLVTEVHAGQPSSLSLALKAGTAASTVEVTAYVPGTQLENAAAGSLVSGVQMRELSLSSRNYEQLLYLQPGISGAVPGPLDRGNFSASGATSQSTFSVNGQAITQNGYFLDGQDMINHGGNAQTVLFPSVESVQEMSLLRNTYGAEYGGGGGAVFTVSSKAGTVDFHGGAYDFYRSQVLNANNYFNNQVGLARPGIRYNDFGYYAGGPLWITGRGSRSAAKTFIFAGQQFLREEAQTTETLTSIPTLDQRQGIFSHPVCTTYTGSTCTQQTTRIASIDPTAQAYLRDVLNAIPLPNNPNGDAQGLTFSAPGFNNESQVFARVDHQIGQRLNLFLRYIRDPFHLVVPNGFQLTSGAPGVGTSTIAAIGNGYLAHATLALTPKTVIEGGYGYLSNNVAVGVIGSLATANAPDIRPVLPYVSTIAHVPNLTINGRAFSAAGPSNQNQYTNQVFVNVTHTAGAHTMFAGGNVEIYTYGRNQGTTNSGAYTFTSNSRAFSANTTQFEQSFAQFLLGQVSSFQQASIDAASTNHSSLYEAYIQDDYRPTSRLTMNAGLRYFLKVQPRLGRFQGYPQLAFSNFDAATFSSVAAPTIDSSGLICSTTPCAGGGTPNLQYNAQNGLIMAGINSPFGKSIVNQPVLNFAPRAGFALDVFGNGKTSLRSGFGIYYVQISNSVFQNIPFTNPPNVSTTTITNTSFGNPGNGVPTLSSAPLLLQTIDPNTRTPYVQDWDLDVQQQLPHAVIADVGYFGNHAVHQLGQIDLNQPVTGAYVRGTSIASGGVTAANTTILNRVRPYPGYGSINEYTSLFSGNYHSVQASLRKQFTGRSLLNLNYTYSKGLTNTQGDGSSPQDIYNMAAEYGPSPYQRKHLFSASFVYEEPYFRHSEAVVRALLAGWEVTSIVTAGSGLYSTALTSAQDPGGIGLLATSVAASARPDHLSNPNSGAPHTAAKWFDTAAFALVPAGQVRNGDAGVNTILGPGYQNWDTSAFKNIHIHDSVDAQLRFEAFNVFNHTNFQALGTTLGTSAFGTVTAAASARILQLGAKVTF